MKTTIKHQLYGRCKGKYGVKGRNAFHAVFFTISSNRTFVRKNPFCYNVGKGGQAICEIQNTKYYIAIDEHERKIIISSLNNLRNKLIAEGRYTDAVDDVLVKVVHAPIRKFKVRITED